MQNVAVNKQSTATPFGWISLFFVGILILLTWGFYKTYIIFFPSFTGFSAIEHFHGAMMLTWMAMLIVQPLLIRKGKNGIHRIIGKSSFIIAPLVMVSIFLVAKMAFHRPGPPMSYEERVGLIALSIPNLLAFGIFYILAILNRRNMYNHMRYMIGTSLLMIGPGLGRALIVYFQYSLPEAALYDKYLPIGIASALLITDIIRKRSLTAYSIVLAVILLFSLLTWIYRLSPVWQGIGGFIAKNFF